jgi:hypothetical protein
MLTARRFLPPPFTLLKDASADDKSRCAST